MEKNRINRWRLPLRMLGAIGISVALSGCIVEPLPGPYHHYHPYHYGYGYYGGY